MDPYVLNMNRCRRVGSRIAGTIIELVEGWTVRQIPPRCCVWIDNQGKCYKSFLVVGTALAKSQVSKSVAQSETLMGTDTGSEYQPSPEKKQKGLFSLSKGTVYYIRDKHGSQCIGIKHPLCQYSHPVAASCNQLPYQIHCL